MHIWIEQKHVIFLNLVQLFLHTSTFTVYTLLSTFMQFHTSFMIELRTLMMEPQLNYAQCRQKVSEWYIVFHNNNICLLFHAVSFKTVPSNIIQWAQLLCHYWKRVLMFSLQSCTSTGCGEYREHGTTVMLIWARSSCTDKSVGRNIVTVKNQLYCATRQVILLHIFL